MPITELFGDDVPFTSTGDNQDYFVRALNVLSSDSTVFTFNDVNFNQFTIGGSVFASNEAIQGDGFGNEVHVLTGASIVSGRTAIVLAGPSLRVVNNGDIVGSAAISLTSTGGSIIINNGSLSADGIGVNFGGSGSHTLNNTGQISANGIAGVAVTTAATITNAGTISGDIGILALETPSLTGEPVEIFNTGAIFGTAENIFSDTLTSIQGASSTEMVINSGQLFGDVLLDDGDDRIDTRSGIVAGEIDLGDGNDVAIGSQEDDIIIAGAGDDIVRAGGDDDTVTGGDGDDILRGAGGDDDLRGENDDDLIFGGTGDDVIRGNTGNDELRGGTGDDNMAGGSGDDEIHGGRGDDTLTGNSGADVFVFNASAGNDTIFDFRVNLDTIDLSAFGTRFNRVDAATEVVNGNAIIDLDMLGGEGTIVVLGVGGNLDANDFIF